MPNLFSALKPQRVLYTTDTNRRGEAVLVRRRDDKHPSSSQSKSKPKTYVENRNGKMYAVVSHGRSNESQGSRNRPMREPSFVGFPPGHDPRGDGPPSGPSMQGMHGGGFGGYAGGPGEDYAPHPYDVPPQHYPPGPPPFSAYGGGAEHDDFAALPRPYPGARPPPPSFEPPSPSFGGRPAQPFGALPRPYPGARPPPPTFESRPPQDWNDEPMRGGPSPRFEIREPRYDDREPRYEPGFSYSPRQTRPPSWD